jgi:DNA-binding NarL/FixJ family response regulator
LRHQPPREVEVLRLVARGASNKEIVHRFVGISNRIDSM